MYRTDDKPSAIREVQTYLRGISHMEASIPLVAVDGVYGDVTEEAVRAFQKSRDLSETGIVNYATFTALYEAYRTYREIRKINSVPSHGDFPLRIGDRGEGVSMLHSLLRMLGEYYSDLGRIPIGNSAFSSDTERAVRYLQTVFLLDPTGIVTKKLYLRMERELSACRMAGRSNFSPIA